MISYNLAFDIGLLGGAWVGFRLRAQEGRPNQEPSCGDIFASAIVGGFAAMLANGALGAFVRLGECSYAGSCEQNDYDNATLAALPIIVMLGSYYGRGVPAAPREGERELPV